MKQPTKTFLAALVAAGVIWTGGALNSRRIEQRETELQSKCEAENMSDHVNQALANSGLVAALTDEEIAVLAKRRERHLIVDRDTKYSAAFRAFLAREGIEVIRLPPRSPNLNAFAERFVRSVKSECLAKIIPFGAPMLRRALREYTDHCHRERNHQGLDNRLISPMQMRRPQSKRIESSVRLAGMLCFYERAAA